ncbi:hypothetical protein N7494_010316 [Penicillium frequentans]|uniref:Uncharacterized protein n=1 Tax=Penicillium frequentans TaxID=3151616 RepID=A0AAD6CI47_9EURO|nr:hypothetical protein N7494_010316 [Penicillium glabrum]
MCSAKNADTRVDHIPEQAKIAPAVNADLNQKNQLQQFSIAGLPVQPTMPWAFLGTNRERPGPNTAAGDRQEQL